MTKLVMELGNTKVTKVTFLPKKVINQHDIKPYLVALKRAETKQSSVIGERELVKAEK